MKPLSLPVLAAAVFGVGVVVLAYAHHGSSAAAPLVASGTAPTATPRHDEGSGELQQEVASMRRDLLQLRGDLADRQPGDAPPRVQPVEGAVVPTPEDSKADWEAHMSTVASTFRAEPTNAAWSRTMAASVREVFEGDASLGPQLRSVECRSATCRVELGAEKDEGAAKSLPIVVNKLGASLPNMQASHEEDERGVPRMVLYFSRS